MLNNYELVARCQMQSMFIEPRLQIWYNVYPQVSYRQPNRIVCCQSPLSVRTASIFFTYFRAFIPRPFSLRVGQMQLL